MAIMIPESISAYTNITAGEKRVFKILKELLPSDYIVWYDLRVNNRYPDFIIVGPDLGLVVLEVKDWQIGSIQEADTNTYTLKGDGNHNNPLKQARGYMFNIVNELKKDKKLTDINGKFKGNLKFCYGHGVVFSRIAKDLFLKSPFDGTINETSILFQDELKLIEDTYNKDLLLEKINLMIPAKFNFEPLPLDIIDQIRGDIFKEVKLSTDNDAIFKVMNINQEQYAKGIGYGHRVIRGVAGSGKTVVLMCRAKYLSELHKDWNILVLCYNKTLATFLKNSIIDDDIENVEVIHFHGWANNIFKNYNLATAMHDKTVFENISRITDEMLANEKKYDAIIIDEGQDFDKEWLQFIVKMLRNPEHSHLLLASDGAQNLYNRKYTLKSVGIKATGRTVIMRENYRNTKQILNFAHQFLMADDIDKSNDEEDNNFIINPETSLRVGAEPQLTSCCDFKGEVSNISKEILKLNKEGVEFGDICVLHPYRKYQDVDYLGIMEEIFKIECIPYFPISKSSNTKSKFKLDNRSIKISTIHSAKGLDFKVIFICGLNNGLLKWNSYEESKKLLYVGMTRARDVLNITYSVPNKITMSLLDTYCKNIKDIKGIQAGVTMDTAVEEGMERTSNSTGIFSKIKAMFKL